ncbi:KH domain-containing protein HEN4 isoform X1 [Glycine soja]|uniref:RNA-binding KH domain-containing protein RCF3 isoform A n=2 Tax=Glycine soja TaxID=3848 RepID=A0A445JBC5_GLYSO|nr:KH domain-containing protein HEN4 isoform X1 [Glycine soja]RZB95627.1 RNA-binding KH domain-containing protein RCF3 isoform A [Glycine soja]
MADPNSNPNHSNAHVNRSRYYTTHVTFRLLCHASRVGAIIGKSGVLIKSLQEATGAKIRIVDAPPDSPDRVILVSAPSAAEDGELSTAQEALLKVFDRVLDVAAGTEVGDLVVSCRLLAETSQVGAVIGKAGKVVEKIRMDTGCKIRVLNEGLPAGTAPSDEIVEIEGQLTSVKKALIAVSHRLQDCPPPDRTKMTGSRHYEVVQSETFSVPLESLTNLHIDHHLQRSSTLSTLSNRSNGNASGAHKLSAEVNRVSALDPKAYQQEVTFRIICSNDRVGAVIGKGGSIVRALQNESGAIISVGPSLVECEDRLVTITASENPESTYSPAQKAVVLVFSKSVEAGVEKGLDLGSKKEPYVTARLVVPSNQVGCLLGKGGAIVSEMRKATGANIRVIGNDQVPMCVSDNDQLVQISGVFSNVQAAIHNATGRLRDHLFVSTQNSGGARSLSSVLAGGQPTLAISHSLNRHSLPGLQAPQTVAGINSRGTNGVSRGLISRKGGLELISGSKTAIVTNTTVQIVVPDDVIGSVYGENGSNLARLRQISGAKVIVHEPRPGTSDRTIIISGTPDETRAAQSLLQAFILAGSS